jgi:sulfonate transport system permease protein
MKKILLGLWLPALILVSWEAAASAGILNRLIFPPPSAILRAANEMILRGELQQHLGATLTRLFLGFLIGSFSGLGCGVLMGLVRVARYSLEPIISGVYATPKLSLLPMLMLFMGVGEPARVFLIAMGCFALMAIHGLDALRHVNHRFVELAANYGASRRMIISRVYLPASLPQIFTGLRIALGRSLTITIALELVSCPDGLGSMIWMAWQTFYTEKLYIGVILSAILGTLLHFSLKRLEARFVPWKNQAQ